MRWHRGVVSSPYSGDVEPYVIFLTHAWQGAMSVVYSIYEIYQLFGRKTHLYMAKASA